MSFYSDNTVTVKPLDYNQSITLCKGLEMVEINPEEMNTQSLLRSPLSPRACLKCLGITKTLENSQNHISRFSSILSYSVITCLQTLVPILNTYPFYTNFSRKTVTKTPHHTPYLRSHTSFSRFSHSFLLLIT